MDLGCLADNAYRTLNQVVVMGAFVFVVMLFAVSLAGTPLVMWLYRRRVVRLMSMKDAADDTVVADAPLQAAPPCAPIEPSVLVQEAAARERRLRNVLVAACAVYSIVAGLLITLSPSVLDASDAGPPGGALQLLATALLDTLMVGALCMPIVLIGISHPRFGRLYWRRFAPLLVGAAALRFGLNAADGDGSASGLAAVFFALTFVALFYAAVARRHARQVAPLLNVLFGTLFAGLALAVGLLIVADPCRTPGTAEGTGTDVVLMLAGVATALGAFWAAWRLVQWLSRRYERKAVSDAQLQTGSWQLTLTAFVALGVIGFERQVAGPWLLLLLAANALALATYAAGLRRVPAWTQPRALLLLRVFAQDERGERLLDETAFRWRFIGPIHMIGGPDMAQQTLDPHELLLFMRGRAREQFVDTRATLAARLAALDEAPDPDRRYRVNELFCFDGVWQAGVRALLAHCAVVLLDLRGFTRQRNGTAFEIGLLAEAGALPRTVCLVDEGTDLAAANAIVAAHGHAALAEARVLAAGARLDAKALFAALASAAASPGPTDRHRAGPASVPVRAAGPA